MILRRRRSQPKPELSAEAIRREYAELLRHFFAGRMTNVEYERRYDALVRGGSTPDEVWDIYDAAWHLYCDIRTHTMAGDRRPSPCLRRRIARWIAFLYSDAPYDADSGSAARNQGAFSRIIGCIEIIWALGILVAWPAVPLLLVLGYSRLGGLVSLCLVAAFVGAWIWTAFRTSGRRAFSEDETDPWPFASAADMRGALARPKLLAGGRY